MPVMVLLFQAFVVATIVAARIHSRSAATVAAVGWSVTTLILVFMPWLMALQLTIVWGAYAWSLSRRSLELPPGDPARNYALFAATCLALGPFMLPLFGVGAIAGWAAWRRISDTDRFDGPRIPLRQVTASTPNWRSHYMRACESPAESAFLKAMIARYAMLPDKGVLVARGIRLEMQKPIGRYRADFVANGRLVIEIDGARWHGSPEAKARDAQRDRDMRKMGLKIIRIPARTVFRAPARAVALVEGASR